MMTAKEFTALLKYPELLKEAPIEELRELIEAYPYSQVLHNLLAKRLHDQDAAAFEGALNKASTYTSDRVFLYHYVNNEVEQGNVEPSPLNDLLEKPVEELPLPIEKEEKEIVLPNTKKEEAKIISINRPSIKTPPKEEPSEGLDMSTLENSLATIEEKPKETVIKTADEPTYEETDALIDEIKEDFEALQKKVKEEEQEKTAKWEAEKVKQEQADLTLEIERDLAALKKKEEEPPFLKVVQRILENKESEIDEDELEEEEEPITVTHQLPKLKENIAAKNTLLSSLEEFDSIKATEEEEDEEGLEEKRAEELFEGGAYNKWLSSFQPSNLEERTKEMQGEKGAFIAEQSVSENKEIVTESLAQLYAIQGKKDQAIWMYKQLILKNPEKSDYFVEKIDYLKNN